jgi:hypothetical protein
MITQEIRFSRISSGMGRILGCERAYARSHPKIRGFTTAIPKDPEIMLVHPDLLNCARECLKRQNIFFEFYDFNGNSSAMPRKWPN